MGDYCFVKRAVITMALNYVCPKFYRDFAISSFRPRSIHPAIHLAFTFDKIDFLIRLYLKQRVCRVLYLLYGKIGSDVVGRGEGLVESGRRGKRLYTIFVFSCHGSVKYKENHYFCYQ